MTLAGLTGTLEVMSFMDVLYLLFSNSRTGTFRLLAADGRKGSIFFYHGRFLHAETASAQGEEALAEMVCWPKGGFSFTEHEKPAVATITRPAVQVLEQLSALSAEWQTVQHIVGDPLAQPLVQAEITTTITLSPLAWRVLQACSGQQTISAVATAFDLTFLKLGQVLQPLVEAGAISFVTVAMDNPALVAPAHLENLVARLATTLGPIAWVLVERTARTLQADLNAFPHSLLSTLITQLSSQISDPTKRQQFLLDVKAAGIL